MPEDVQSYIREYQGMMKAKRDTGTYSQQKCIIAIIREHKKLAETRPEIFDRVPPKNEADSN